MAEKDIELASAIANLRKQLQEATQEGKGEDLRFAVRDIEIELKCTVKRKGAGKAGVKFWVINAETKGGLSKDTIQTVKLKLLPLDKKGKSALLSDVDEVK